jgi:tRNA threonylcarbamoyladenosine biosynthesis protein TsaB
LRFVLRALNILALDTSSEYCSVALWLDGEVHALERLAGQRHTEMVLPMVDELLARAGLELSQLSGIAYGAGPGSFTGLRIACGLAQGLALGAGLRVLGVSTLEALAQACAAQRVMACLDARIGEIYHAAYERDAARGREMGAWRVVSPPRLCRPEEAPEVPDGGWWGCGSGFDAYREALEKRYGARVARVLSGLRPRAGEIAVLAAPRFAAGQGGDAAEAVPLYLRDKVALREEER